MSAHAFMQEFYFETEPNPFCNHERVWRMQVAFEVVKSPSGTIHLRLIRSLVRRRGCGSAGLDWLNELADKHNVSIIGWVAKVGTTQPRLTVRQLTAWYRRHGYTVDKQYRLYRVPQNTALPNALRLGTIAALSK